jgi:hypothetical protein
MANSQKHNVSCDDACASQISSKPGTFRLLCRASKSSIVLYGYQYVGLISHVDGRSITVDDPSLCHMRNLSPLDCQSVHLLALWSHVCGLSFPSLKSIETHSPLNFILKKYFLSFIVFYSFTV